MGAGSGVLRAQTPRVVKVSGGLNVAGLVLDGVSLDVNGGTLTRFDNVTFQTFYAPALLRIRHAGTGNVFTMNNIYFLLPPSQGSYWIDAEDTDAATGALTLDVVSAQAADGPSNTRVTNGAIVTWHAPAVGGGGGGGGNP